MATVEIPSHVPPELVMPIGLVEGPEYLASPFDFMASLHETHPRLFYSPSANVGNRWTVTRYEDAYYVLRNPDLFTVRGATPFPRDPDDWFDMIPIEIEAPDHRKYRAILDRMLSPRSIIALQDDIARMANDLIDGFIDKGECEFTEAFGRPLPVSVFLDIMGLPREMRDTFVAWAMRLLHSNSRAAMEEVMVDISAYLKAEIGEKARVPDDGAVSAIVRGTKDGEPLSDADVFGFTFFLFVAGLDTVFATLNNIFLWLARNPDRRREIMADPENIDSAVEELLRYFTVTFSGRVVAQDLTMHGVELKQGERVSLVLPACNRDPLAFDRPGEVDFHRPRKPNLAFSGGAHSCMGAHLARLEIKICIVEFLRRIPDFAVKEGAEIVYWPGGVVGPKTLPLVW